MKCTDGNGNVCTCFVECPDIISIFFALSNVIDMNNQPRQHILAVEKKCLTKRPNFWLVTTLNGINVADIFLLANYHGVINLSKSLEDKKMTICTFAGITAHQLISNAE